jgi:hypothetical protein
VPSPRDAGLSIFVIGILLALSLRFDVGALALIAFFVVGVDLRFESIGSGFSDVGVVVRAGIDLAVSGGNPYGVGYAVSSPPGAPFAYGPLALLWYLAVAEPWVMELVVSIVILVLLTLRGGPMGLAIYATMPILAGLASDGSNDTSAGLLLLVGLVLMERMPRTGAFVLGLAIAFKPYALAWLPPLFMWAGAGALVAALFGAAIFWLPALIIWGPGAILRSFQLAESVHTSPYYSLAVALQRFFGPVSADVMGIFRLLAGGLTTIAVLPVVRSHAGVVVGGTLIYLVTLFTGYWSTFAYFAAIAPVLAWYLDDWLGPEGVRVRWQVLEGPIAEIDKSWPRVARA